MNFQNDKYKYRKSNSTAGYFNPLNANHYHHNYTGNQNHVQSIRSSLDSSNKLDDLLRQCRELGTKSNGSTTAATAPAVAPGPNVTKSAQPTSSTSHIPATNSAKTGPNPIQPKLVPIQSVQTNNKLVVSSSTTSAYKLNNKVENQMNKSNSSPAIAYNAIKTPQMAKQHGATINASPNYKYTRNQYSTLNPNLNSSSVASSSRYSLNRHNPTTITNPAALTSKINRVVSAKNNSGNKYKLNNISSLAYSSSVSRRNGKQNSTKIVNRAPQKPFDINVVLGRRVENMSKNRFKFIRRKSSSLYDTGALYNTRLGTYKLQRVSKSSSRTMMMMLKNARHQPSVFKISKSGKKLKRINRPNNIDRLPAILNRYKLVNNSTKSLVKNSSNRCLFSIVRKSNPTKVTTNIKSIQIANNLVNRSKMTINRTKQVAVDSKTISRTTQPMSLDNHNKSINNTKEKKYCLFYNRFGRCSRGDKCPFIHDPKRIALCPRFLRGTCDVENCPYSHTTSEEKMPICSYFVAGCCNREKCPYQHVYYGKDVAFCVEFAKGFCPLGSKCDKMHINECPDYERDRKCPRGAQCPLIHRNRSKKLKNLTEPTLTRPKTQPLMDEPCPLTDESFISLKRKMENPTEISEKPVTIPQAESTSTNNPEQGLKLRPNFQFKK